MKIIRTIPALRKQLSRVKGPVGFVPTMGCFHEGHCSLMRRAAAENQCCVASIFVNPVQFGPSEDFSRYPRDLARDTRLARSAGVDLLFVPSVDVMYPRGVPLTSVDVSGFSEGLCGAVRPGHFRGVAVVVAKLMNIVQPQVMYLGQKDAQQVFVIRRMSEDLDFPVRVVVCPTVREADGLAMSSRNRYLSAEHRRQAASLHAALERARSAVINGESDAVRIISLIKKLILDETDASIDYVSCVSIAGLKPVRRINEDVLVAVAVRFSSARLIDNIIIKHNDKKTPNIETGYRRLRSDRVAHRRERQ
jgi:pantoate--beta-alanine ligase